MEGMASFSLDISPWGAMGGLFVAKFMHNLVFQEVQLSEKVHHWTLDGSYGSRDFKIATNVPMKLSSFYFGSLIASIFGKLKLPSQARAEEEEENNDDGEHIQGVQAHVPLRSGMENPRRGEPLTPTPA